MAEQRQNAHNLPIADQIQLIGQLVQNLPDAIAQGLREGSTRTGGSHIPDFRGEGPDPTQEYFNWERCIKLCRTLNRWSVDTTVKQCLIAMKGRAGRIAVNLRAEDGAYPTVDAFLNEVRKIFVSSSYKEVARLRFEQREQKRGEDTRSYHQVLLHLWEDAYKEEEEPWHSGNGNPPLGREHEPPGHKSRKLIDRFLRGISHPRVKDRVLSAELFNKVDDYVTALQKVLDSEVIQEKIDKGWTEKKWKETQRFQPRELMPGEQRMEIGNVQNATNGSRNKPNPNKAKNMNNPYPHKNKPGGKNTTPKPPADKSKRSRKDDVCKFCNKKGHWQKDCYRYQHAKQQSWINQIAEEDEENFEVHNPYAEDPNPSTPTDENEADKEPEWYGDWQKENPEWYSDGWGYEDNDKVGHESNTHYSEN